jgi:hypothetical protein
MENDWSDIGGHHLPHENQTSSSEVLSDSRKDLISWNWIDTSGTEFRKPTLGNPYPFRVNVRVWNIQCAKEGVNHDDALFYGECGGLLNDVFCAVHNTPPQVKTERTTVFHPTQFSALL